MRSKAEIKDRILSQLTDTVEATMIQTCNGVHPLMIFVEDFYRPEFKDKVVLLTEENIIKEMQEYIDFAFTKARDQRGISASRSIWRFEQWLWALEDTEITCFDYEDYGISLLERIAKKYNLKHA